MSRTRCYMLLTGMLLACLLTPDASAQLSPLPIRIINPVDGTVVTSDTDVDVVAELAPEFQDPSNFDFIQFTVVNSDGTSTFELGQGDLRSLMSQELAQTIWSTRPVPSGTYTIRAFLQDLKGNRFQDSVEVTLNRAPGLQVVVLSKRLAPGGAELTLVADARDIEGDAITRVLWSPGDGSDAVEFDDLAPFTHFYEGIPGETTPYVLTVTVDDARGARTTIQREVLVSDADVLVQQAHGCGCTEMEIFSVTRPASDIFCVPQPPGLAGLIPPGCFRPMMDPPGADRCPAGFTHFQCPLGPYFPTAPAPRNVARLGWTWEVNAHLDPLTTDIKRCSEGQVIQRTATRGGNPITNQTAKRSPPRMEALPFPEPPEGRVVSENSPYPKVGERDTDPPRRLKWGADNYTAPLKNDFPYKRHFPGVGRIRWLDGPGIDQKGRNALTQQDRFVTWVTGNLGTCWCQFEVHHEWTMAGGRTGPGGALPAPTVVTRLDGKNCTVVQPPPP